MIKPISNKKSLCCVSGGILPVALPAAAAATTATLAMIATMKSCSPPVPPIKPPHDNEPPHGHSQHQDRKK